jgi:uncharacterized protein YggE
MRDLGDGGDVDDFERRVGRAFEERRLGVRAHRRAPGVEVGAVDQGRGDAEARQQLLDDIEARAEQRPPATMWSPALTWPISEAVTAAMPLAVARAASAPSSSAMRRSNIATVGLEKRE